MSCNFRDNSKMRWGVFTCLSHSTSTIGSSPAANCATRKPFSFGAKSASAKAPDPDGSAPSRSAVVMPERPCVPGAARSSPLSCSGRSSAEAAATDCSALVDQPPYHTGASSSAPLHVTCGLYVPCELPVHRRSASNLRSRRRNGRPLHRAGTCRACPGP